MHKINLHPDYYTTSSCSGRIAIYCEGLDDDKTTTKGGVWLFVSHDPVEVEQQDIVSLLFGDQAEKVVFEQGQGDILNKQLIYFKFEPLILHIEASTYETGMHLLAVASQVGYQNSGMTPSKRHMLAIRSTLKIDTPIAYVADDGRIHCLVDPSFLSLLVQMANEKFEQNIKRMKIFEDAVQQELSKQEKKAQWESKEDRRERKRREGLERAAAAMQEKKQEIEDVVDVLEATRLE
ncbi:hypothetical protein K501DRAFT_233834 [Backusella circina FSU 941]|nr:hypothetical protein K501DRAFT_233834 [Backusella circina FSU 941]